MVVWTTHHSNSLPRAPASTMRRTQANVVKKKNKIKSSATSVFMLKLKPTSYIYLSQICPAERQEQQNAVWNCDDPGEELSAPQTDKLITPVKCTAAHCLPSWGFWRFLHRTVSDSCSCLGRHRLVNNTLRQSDLGGSGEQEKKDGSTASLANVLWLHSRQ